MKKHYIKAVIELLLAGRDVDAVLANLNAILRKKGHEKLLPSILKGVATELALKKADASAIVVAAEADRERLASAIADALQKIGGNASNASVSVDQTLIGGFIVTHEGKLINRSYKERLLALYRSITK